MDIIKGMENKYMLKIIKGRKNKGAKKEIKEKMEKSRINLKPGMHRYRMGRTDMLYTQA